MSDAQIEEWIRAIEAEWEMPLGFFGALREGHLDESAASRTLRILVGIHIENASQINRRLVALLWSIPLFMTWQKDRVVEKGGRADALDRWTTRLTNELERVLGMP
jgi:hypothetical protein